MSAPNFNVEFIAKHWHKRSGFIALLLPIIGLEVFALYSYPIWLALTAALSAIAIEILWRFSRSLPRTKRGKLGFVICISYDDEIHAKKIRADLVFNLHRLLKRGQTGPSFQVIEIHRHRAEAVVHDDDAQQIRIETRAHFVLYGRVRKRSIGGKDHHFVELDGIVSHVPISREASLNLGKEFAELLPRKLLIPNENDLFAFEFTSEWTELVARYVIGIAAQLSGDFDYAAQLYQDAFGKLQTSKSLPVSAKLLERIPTRLAELHEGRAVAAYEVWASTHADEAIDQLSQHLAPIEAGTYRSPSVLNLLAISAFLKQKNVDRALHWLNQFAAQNRDGTWHLNVAFLFAYQGNLRFAIRHYRVALRQQIEMDVIGKIEDFVYYVVSKEPDKYQLFFCLGFFNWHFKSDTLQALKDFKAFLGSKRHGQFVREVQLASKWVLELEAANR